ncbi:uncharacterized protein YbjT (DUF2867 family) [Saccharothrix coeruleofusca]|uniref:SDR family oxidoreductase n=1 Tax=Saccharothrix coeruleofusca TaxID=33919 RepID=UPI001AE42CCC|nr:NAD(P)H-binding protein [Saccharothrix coeruleofusca]MBP2339191.1 uncharacterized protein YbjT (DUF2867 family) [Saccharothrix coeruleofusca]
MILVTGATGTVGRCVVEQLAALGEPVRALTRNPSRATFPTGVEVVGGDLTKPAELPLDDVTAVFLLAALDSEAVAEHAAALAERVPRVVFLSSSAVAVRRPGSYETHEAVEKAIEQSGAEWTHLRPGEFMANKLVWASSIKSANVVRAAYPDAIGVPIHEADIAEVAVLALRSPDHAGQAYFLTGPEALTHREQAAAIGRGLGREIGFETLTYGQARAALIRDAGLPWDIAEYLMGYQSEHAQEPPSVSPVFERVTGHQGRTLTQWAADHAAELS